MNWIRNIIIGALVGIANLIPGFSGGTIAYMTGIYEKLLNAISDYLPNKQGKRLAYTFFLLQIGISAAVAILLLAKPILYVTSTPIPAQHFYFFVVGAILGSIAVVVKNEEDMQINANRLIVFVITIAAFLFLTYKLKIQTDEKWLPQVTGEIMGFKLTEMLPGYYLWLFVLGILGAGSMILPGFSGSALLMSFGEYKHILGFINERMIIPLGVFALGCGLGILILAKLLSVLLKKYKGGTQYFIMGLMVASICKLFEKAMPLNMSYLITSGILLICGILFAYIVGKKGQH